MAQQAFYVSFMAGPGEPAEFHGPFMNKSDVDAFIEDELPDDQSAFVFSVVGNVRTN